MKNIADDLEARITSIEKRLNNMERYAITKDDFEKELTVLIKRQVDISKNDCDDWINEVLGS